MSILFKNNIKLLVSDMAGTIINEKGIIYDAIEKALNTLDYRVAQCEKNSWHGKDKREVIYNHIDHFHDPLTNIDPFVDKAEKIMLKELEKEYFQNSNATLIPNVISTFDRLRFGGIKIALNTGYPKKMQKKIIDHFNLEDHIDSYISSEEVRFGRPYPYMIYNLMEKHGIDNVKKVAKIGDTLNDCTEGKNAGCGLTIGVLSGADSERKLKYKADLVLQDISKIVKI